MSTPKFQKQYEEMISGNSELFAELKMKSRKPSSPEFREVQLKMLRIIRRNEDILCKKTENTRYSSFSTGLADRFWELVRADYPEIDYTA